MTRAATAATCVILVATGLPRSALAQQIEIVELNDGSKYQGQLVEKVEGKQVVIQLATGEIKTFPWDQVASARAAPAPPPPAPSSSSLPDLPAPATTPPVVASTPTDSGHVITGCPDPPASPAAEPPSSKPSGQQLELGVVTSLPQFGSPRGIAGLLAGYKPVGWLGLELTGAYDGPAEVAEGNLGWSLAETLTLGDGWGLGAGASQHFGATGNGVAHMGHAEGFFDLDLQGMVSPPITVRMAFGAAMMFNAADHPGACGFFNLAGGSTDQNGNPNDTSCTIIYFDVEVFYRVRLGGGGDAQ